MDKYILDVELLQHIHKYADENKINLKKLHLLELRKFFDIKNLKTTPMNGKYGLQYTYYLPINEARTIYKTITSVISKLEFSKKKKCRRYFTKVFKVWSFKDRNFISTDLGMFEKIEDNYYKINGEFKIIYPNIKLNEKELKDVLVWIN